MSKDYSKYTGSFLKIWVILIVVIGAVLRIAVYLQNRDLIIDEANITRNLYERDFLQLLSPLNYEQYAPPVFLWIVKFCSVVAGFSEYSLKFYPLLAGLLSLWVMYLLLKELVPMRALWYALFLFATAHMLIRYSTELKQYMGDVLITISLLLLALRVKLTETTNTRFACIWILAGSLSVWSSMPAVFVLAGVGLYYMIQAYRQKYYKGLGLVLLCGFVWVAQFAFYYFTILKEQANSSYLQNFHRDNFLFATPSDMHELMHNWAVFSALLRMFGNNIPFDYNIVFNVILLLAGAFILLKHNLARGVLLLVPILAMLFAAALNQFSLLPRVALFSVPVFLVIIAYGLEQLYRIRLKAVHVVITSLTIIYAYNGNSICMLWKPFKTEQLTEGFAFLKKHHIKGDNTFLYHSSGSAFIYYTQIHPQKDKWQFLKNAEVLKWNTHYDSLSYVLANDIKIAEPAGFLFTNATNAEADERIQKLNKHLKQTASIDTNFIWAYIFVNPNLQ